MQNMNIIFWVISKQKNRGEGGRMLDARIPLKTGEKLKSENGTEYEIEKLIGKGANCLVYDATYEDKVCVKHKVRVKELFPIHIPLEREFDGRITGDVEALEKYKKIKEKYIETYKCNVEIRNTEGITNSTSDAEELLACNGTYYSICRFDEGINYQDYTDDTLFELLKHINALAKAIKQYHDKGYLHLDIKPGNVFILPETAEHIMLFDFDSVVKIEDLKEKSIGLLSYSERFSAPEQVGGKVWRIDTWSDIYSIGAVLYYKLFGKLPPKSGIKLGTTVNIDETVFETEVIAPKLVKLLQFFLKKTLMTSSHARWKKMDDVITVLEQMIPLADPSQSFVMDNFNYNNRCFVGRTNELQEIQKILKSKQLVFLSGMGGIGKTEIAKRYAYSYRKQYNTIVFLRYETSLKNTIVSNDIEIRNFECEKDENSEGYFRTKLGALKKLLTPEDLLIIDNFDVEYDDNLEDLLECSCKFIFTTREDYRDYDYEQIEVEHLDSIDDAMELFCSYNDREYAEEEKQALEMIMKFVDNHTMMIVLLAKYLRDSDEMPTVLYKKFREIEGVTNTGDTRVKHRKDKNLRAQRVNLHLQTLFEFSDFTKIEIQLMRALSLLGPIKLQKQVWLNMVNHCFDNDDIERLVKKGWIEADLSEKDYKISLHQIILDMIYNQKAPDTSNCAEPIKGYILYLQKEMEYAVDRRTKKKLADILLDRIHGKDCLLAEFYYIYCKYIEWKPEILENAEKICIEADTNTAKLILAETNILRIKKIKMDSDWWSLDDEQQRKEITDLYYNEINPRREKVLKYIREYSGDSYPPVMTAIQLLSELAESICFVANTICEDNMILEEGAVLGFDLFYQASKQILVNLENCVLINSSELFPLELKEKLLKQLIKFYGEGGFEEDAKGQCVGDLDKSAYYTECLEKLKYPSPEENDMFWEDGTSYEEAADSAMFENKSYKAIGLYKKALEKKEGPVDTLTYKMCEAFIDCGNFEEAEKELLKIAEYVKKNNLDVLQTYRKLAELYKKRKDFTKAIEYYKKIIEKIEPADTIDEKEETLEVLLELITFDMIEESVRNKYMDKCVDYLRIIAKEENIDPWLSDSLENIWKLWMDKNYDEELVEIFYRIATRYRVNGGDETAKQVYRCLINHPNVRNENKDLFIKSLLWSADLFINTAQDSYETADELLCEVENTNFEACSNKGYYEEKLHKLRCELKELGYFDARSEWEDYKFNCDYYFITEFEVAEAAISVREQFEMWIDTLVEYRWINDKENMKRCLNKLKDTLSQKTLSRTDKITGLQKYVENVLTAACIMDTDTAIRMTEELQGYISEQMEMNRFSKNEKNDLMLQFAKGSVKNQCEDLGIQTFLNWLYAAIEGKAYDEMNFVPESVTRLSDEQVEQCMVEEMDRKVADEIISEINSFLSVIKENDRYYDLCISLEKIRDYYDQSIVEFKYEISR